MEVTDLVGAPEGFENVVASLAQKRVIARAPVDAVPTRAAAEILKAPNADTDFFQSWLALPDQSSHGSETALRYGSLPGEL